MRTAGAPRLAALAAASALAACVAGEQAHEFPSPDGAYLLRTEVAPWPPFLTGGRQVELTLRHVEGAPVEVARFGGVTRLEMAWLGVGRLKICAEARTREARDRIEVVSPRGRRVFVVDYGCPALGAAATPAPAPSPRTYKEGERRLVERSSPATPSS